MQVQSGIVDKLLTEFERKVLETRKAGLTFVNKFLKKVVYKKIRAQFWNPFSGYIVRKSYQGAHSLEVEGGGN